MSILVVAGHHKPANPCWGPRHRKGSQRHPPEKDGVAEPACGSAGGTACGSPGVPSHGVADIRKDTGASSRADDARPARHTLICIHNINMYTRLRRYMASKLYVRYKKEGKWTWRPATASDILDRDPEAVMKLVEEE